MNDNPVQPQPKADSNIVPAHVQPNTAVNAPVEPQATPSMKPEHEPLGSFIRPSEPEPIIDSVLSEQGVEAVNQHVPNLPPEARSAGVVHAKETIAPNLNPSSNLALTQEQAQVGKKSGTGNSLAWLSALILKVLRV